MSRFSTPSHSEVSYMTLGEIRQCLTENGFTIENESRLGNNTGTQLRLASGAIVNVFDKGTVFLSGQKHRGS